MSKYSHFEMCEKIFGQKYKWNEQKHDYEPYSRTDMWNKMIEQQDKISDLEAKLAESETQLKEEIEEKNGVRRALSACNRQNDEFADMIKKLVNEEEELKQQLHDLPNKIVEEIRKEIEFPLYVHPDFDEFECLFDIDKLLDTILKKYGGEDESNND